MPSINKKICNKCKAIVELPHECPKKRNKTGDKIYNKTKRTNDKFYNSQPWRKKRLNILSRDSGLCQNCLREGRTTLGNTVHHIEEVNDNWELRLVDSNLETICSTCHNKEHGE